MKSKIFAVMLAVAASFNIQANESNTEVCMAFYSLAETVMTVRQMGVPLSKAFVVAQGDPMGEALVEDAYRQPMMNTKEYKQKVINSFAEAVFMKCKDTLKDSPEQGQQQKKGKAI